jgi:hypothetical protein
MADALEVEVRYRALAAEARRLANDSFITSPNIDDIRRGHSILMMLAVAT